MLKILEEDNKVNSEGLIEIKTLAKKVNTSAGLSFEILGNRTILNLLLIKYVYYKIIVGDNVKANELKFITSESIVDNKILTLKRKTFMGEIADSNNNFIISDKDILKCLRILQDFRILSRFTTIRGLCRAGNSIQNFDKFITRKFVKNVEKINILNIAVSYETIASEITLLLSDRDWRKTTGNKIKRNNNTKDYYVRNNLEDFDYVVNWLFQHCEHIETFEIGVFAAVTQALYVTEGFDAFTKFVAYAESLDDENRVNLVNKLIAYFNIITKKSETIHKFVGGNVILTTVLEFIPNIIKSFNLCETIHAYPESMTISIIEANKNNNLYNSFIEITKKYTYFIRAINDYKSKPENFVKINEFNRDKTITMQTIINEYYKFQHYKHKK
jgi:hypothetical protein